MKRAVLLLLCMILMLPMCAVSEEIYLDDASGVYESVFPDTLLILNVLMVDINPDIAADNGQITCEIRNIYCPPGEYVYGVLLFDGWRVIPGYFETGIRVRKHRNRKQEWRIGCQVACTNASQSVRVASRNVHD